MNQDYYIVTTGVSNPTNYWKKYQETLQPYHDYIKEQEKLQGSTEEIELLYQEFLLQRHRILEQLDSNHF